MVQAAQWQVAWFDGSLPVKKLIAAVVLGGSLTGCSLVPLAETPRDAELKTFPVAPDSAGLYIFRNDAVGALVRVEVKLNGEPLGRTATQTYLYRQLAPGKHKIESVSENDETLEVDAKVGTLLFVRKDLTLGTYPMFPATRLQQVSEEEGKKGVLESRLVKQR